MPSDTKTEQSAPLWAFASSQNGSRKLTTIAELKAEFRHPGNAAVLGFAYFRRIGWI